MSASSTDGIQAKPRQAKPQQAKPRQDADAEIRALTEKYFAVYRRKAVEELFAMWSEKSTERAAARDGLERVIFPSVGEIQMRSLTIRKLTVTGENATVRLTLDMSAPDLKTNAPSPYFGVLKRTLRWQMESGQWRVWSYLADERDLANQLLQAQTEAEREQLIAAEPELMTATLLEALLSRQLPYLNNWDLNQGLSYGRFLQTLAEKINDKKLTAKAFNTLALVHNRGGDVAQALALVEKGLGLAEEAGAKTEVSNLLGQAGVLQTRIGQYEKAADSFAKALEIAEQINAKPLLAATLVNFGILQSTQEHFTKAIETNLKAQSLAKELGDRNLFVLIEGNLGVIYFDLGQYNRALTAFRQCLRLMVEMKDRRGENTALINIGSTYLRLGDFQRSLQYLDRGLKLAEELQDANGVSLASQILGGLYLTQQNWSQAIIWYRKSLGINEQTNNISLQARLLSDLANCQFQQGDFRAAIETLQRALPLQEKLGLKMPAALSWYTLGEIHVAQKQYASAMECVQKGLKLATEAGLREAQAEGIYNHATLLYEQKQYEQAAALAEQAAMKSAELQTPLPAQAAHTLAGRSYLALNQPQQARRHFTTAIEIIEKMRQQVGGGGTERQFFFGSKLAPYHGMIALAVEQNRPAEFLAYAQQAQARVLLDALQNRNTGLSAKIGDNERQQEEQLRLRMAELNLRLQRAERKTSGEGKELRAQLEKARMAYEDFRNRLDAAHPQSGIRRGEIRPLTPAEIGKLLPDEQTAFLIFTVTKETVYLSVITKTSGIEPRVSIHSLNIAEKELTKRVEQFRQQLSDRDLNFREPAAELYKLLLQPAQAELAGKNHLILVPDGALWELPFQTLLSAKGRFLLQDYAVSLTPSLSVFAETAKLRKRNSQTGPGLLAIGNPINEPDSAMAETGLLGGNQSSAHLEAQFNALRKLYPAKSAGLYSGKDALESRFKTEAPKHRILHLATHGLLENAGPMYSALQLTAGNGEDGRLEAWEIADLDLQQADLAILAACETARGRIGNGEGMIGLSWSFLIAGCPTVVSSLWKVESSSTTELMLELHRQLNLPARPSPAEALRQAALKLLKEKEYRHPFYWSGFVTIGAPR